MIHRLSWILAGTVCVLASTAHAQPDPIVPAPQNAAPPIVLAPVQPDPKPNKKRVFVVKLQHVRPSLMAYWLDPQNHPAPPGTLAFTPPAKVTLPAGIDRIVTVDPQNTLLVFGTESAVAQLQKDIELLDKILPDGTLPAIAPQKAVSLTLSLYWLDSLLPDSQKWPTSAAVARLARPEELASLQASVQADRASYFVLPSVTALDHTDARLPFGLDTSTIVPPSIDPFLAPGKRSGVPKPDSFIINPDSSIDSGIQAYKVPIPLTKVPLAKVKGDLAVQPLFSGDSRLWLIIKGTGVPFSLLPVQEGDTFLLSGSASEWGLTPPSPRFSSFVLSIQPHIQTKPEPLVVTP